jgi:hypothetical protein
LYSNVLSLGGFETCLPIIVILDSWASMCYRRLTLSDVMLSSQETEVARLAGMEAVADRLRGQLAAADASLAERDSTIQLLAADKAYLSKEVQVRHGAY